MSEIFYCKNCGGIMEFDAATQSLKCPHCGEEQKIDANRSAVREHKLTAEARQMVRVQDKKSTTMQCPSCGAMVEVEPNSTAKDCPYCGTAFVLAEKQTDVIVPDGVVPFQIDKKKVGEVFHKWIKGRFFAPNELKHLYQQDKLQGIYIPYWTFDAKADAVYHAEGGRNRIVEYRDSKGERHTRTEVTCHHEKAQHEAGQGRAAALGGELTLEQGDAEAAQHQADDLRPDILHGGGPVQAQTACGIPQEAGDAEAHVGRVAEKDQQRRNDADDQARNDDMQALTFDVHWEKYLSLLKNSGEYCTI